MLEYKHILSYISFQLKCGLNSECTNSQIYLVILIPSRRSSRGCSGNRSEPRDNGCCGRTAMCRRHFARWPCWPVHIFAARSFSHIVNATS